MSRVLNAIVAVCPNMGIGNNSNLPWHPIRLSNEFKHFRKMTSTPSAEGKQNVVIMGRKTWFSIPEKNRPLSGRINIVLSRELNILNLNHSSSVLSAVVSGVCQVAFREAPPGAHHLASDFSSALRLLDTAEMADTADQVWVIGGSSLYKEVMESPGTRRLFVTRVHKQFDCDTFLPEISMDKYRLLSGVAGVPEGVQEEHGVQYSFEVYESIDH